MSTIIINGKAYSGKGNIVVIGNRVYSDGGLIEDNASGVVEVKIEGDLVSLQSDAPVIVSGNIKGDVRAGGSVSCADVGGSVNAGGSANCGKVMGSVNAGGSVNHRQVSD